MRQIAFAAGALCPGPNRRAHSAPLDTLAGFYGEEWEGKGSSKVQMGGGKWKGREKRWQEVDFDLGSSCSIAVKCTTNSSSFYAPLAMFVPMSTPLFWHLGDVLVTWNDTFYHFVIFAVLDVSLAVNLCINCIFLHLCQLELNINSTRAF